MICSRAPQSTCSSTRPPAFAEDLQKWPPPLEAIEPSLLPVIRGPRPHRLAYAEAFRLARLDLEHEYDAIEARFRS